MEILARQKPLWLLSYKNLQGKLKAGTYGLNHSRAAGLLLRHQRLQLAKPDSYLTGPKSGLEKGLGLGGESLRVLGLRRFHQPRKESKNFCNKICLNEYTGPFHTSSFTATGFPGAWRHLTTWQGLRDCAWTRQGGYFCHHLVAGGDCRARLIMWGAIYNPKVSLVTNNLRANALNCFSHGRYGLMMLTAPQVTPVIKGLSLQAATWTETWGGFLEETGGLACYRLWENHFLDVNLRLCECNIERLE